MPQNNLLLSSSPHVYSKIDTRKIMLAVILALLPVAVYGVVLFGAHALLVILFSVGSAVVFEYLFRLITKQDIRIGDFSAVVTGLLLALILPPSTPLWAVVLGSFAAIVFAKEFFGGLGANPFNPALIGRAILLMSFPQRIGGSWHIPFKAISDATTTATPLTILKLGGSIADVGKSFVEQGVAANADYPSILNVLFLGNRAGCIGESSILLILIGFVFLLLVHVIDWIVPVCMVGSAFVLSFMLGADPVFAILSGGLVFGAVFMATDYSSSALTVKGKVLFGIGAGAMTIIIRQFGGYPEGVTYGILLMNAVTPFLDKLRTKKYGFTEPPKSEGARS